LFIPLHLEQTDSQANILSEFMSLTWLKRDINDITQMSLHLQSSDFKTHAEGNNLEKKKALLNTIREDCEVLMNRYNWVNPSVADQL